MKAAHVAWWFVACCASHVYSRVETCQTFEMRTVLVHAGACAYEAYAPVGPGLVPLAHVRPRIACS
jgi:hypothetical protein